MENLISFGNGLLMYLTIGCVYVMIMSNKIDKALAQANKEGDGIIDTESDGFKLIMYFVIVIFWLPMIFYKPKKEE